MADTQHSEEGPPTVNDMKTNITPETLAAIQKMAERGFPKFTDRRSFTSAAEMRGWKVHPGPDQEWATAYDPQVTRSLSVRFGADDVMISASFSETHGPVVDGRMTPGCNLGYIAGPGALDKALGWMAGRVAATRWLT